MIKYIGCESCDECRSKKDVVEIEDEYEGDVIWICKECLEKALILINKEIENV